MKYDEESLAELLGALPPAPDAWVRAAQQLPALRRTIDELVERAIRDAEFRKALNTDLERALAAAGYAPDPPLLAVVRAALETA
jgi:hypothetical protein